MMVSMFSASRTLTTPPHFAHRMAESVDWLPLGARGASSNVLAPQFTHVDVGAIVPAFHTAVSRP